MEELDGTVGLGVALVIGVGSASASAVEVAVGVAGQEVCEVAGVEGVPVARTGSVVLVTLFVLCQERGGGAFSWDAISRASCSLLCFKRRWTGWDQGGNKSFVAPSLPSSQRRCHGAVDTL